MAKIDELFTTMEGYTQMTEELPFDEFSSYYQDVIACFTADYQDFNAEQLIRAKGICTIMDINASDRATHKDQYRKKFQKIAEKSNFWGNAIKSRLLKDGMSVDEIARQEAALWQD